jgi:hypothetical protein
MWLTLEPLREGDPSNLNVMLSLSQQRFDAWVYVLQIRVFPSWKLFKWCCLGDELKSGRPR